MTNSANLPAPYLGVQQTVPKAGLKSPYCENLFNFNSNAIGISLRHGDSKYKLLDHGIGGIIAKRFAQYGNTKLFALAKSGADVSVWDVDAGTVSTTLVGLGTYSFATLFFNKYLFIFSSSALGAGTVYNGAAGTFGAIGYTGPATAQYGGAVYKHRAYMILLNTASYSYSGIDAISGNCTTVDLSGIITNEATLSIIAPITISDQIASVVFLAFVFSTGEVIFYSGSYPDSDSWAEAGRAQIGQPLDYHSGMSYQGDFLVFCDSGVVSLRDLFLKGSEDAASLTVNSNIQTTWQNLIQAIRTAYTVPNGPLSAPGIGINGQIAGVYDTKTQRIIISSPLYLDTAGVPQYGSFYFVFDTIRQSWKFHRSYGITNGVYDITFYKNKVLIIDYNTDMMVKTKEGATGYTDRNTNDTAEVNFDYDMLSAPIPFEKTADIEVAEIEPIMQSDLYTQTNWNLVADFGKQTSGNQPLTDQGVTVTKPAVNVGMHNITYCQVKMSGTTTSGKTVGLDLYSYNIWFNKGEKASR